MPVAETVSNKIADLGRLRQTVVFLSTSFSRKTSGDCFWIDRGYCDNVLPGLLRSSHPKIFPEFFVGGGSSHQELLCKQSVLKNFVKFTGKHLA